MSEKESTGEPIDSLSAFIEEIEKLGDCQPGYQRFYRGQSVDLPLCPGIFRKTLTGPQSNVSLAEYESDIYYEMVNKKPEEFEKCRCTFDHLVKMQHYRVPTRLLDITPNPLVALCMACLDCEERHKQLAEYKDLENFLNEKKVNSDIVQEYFEGKCEKLNPTVYYIDVPDELIKNYNSDSVTILSVLSRCSKYIKEDIKSKVDTCSKIEELLNNTLQTDKKTYTSVKKRVESAINNMPDKDLFFLRGQNRIDPKIKIELDIDSLETIKYDTKFQLTDEYFIIKNDYLLHEIKQDRSYFNDEMLLNTFNSIFCVKPKLDNPRITRQNGAFLIFPYEDKILTVGGDNDIKVSKISIDFDKTGSILKSLETLDISKEVLYADMDTVSYAVKKKYQDMTTKK